MPGYALQSGKCAPCDPSTAWDAWAPGDKAALLACSVVFGMVVVTLLFLQPLIPSLERAMEAALVSVKAAGSRAMGACRRSPPADSADDAKPALEPLTAKHASEPHTTEPHATKPHSADPHAAAAMMAGAALAMDLALEVSATEMEFGGARISSGGAAGLTVEGMQDMMKVLERALKAMEKTSKIVVNFYQERPVPPVSFPPSPCV